MKSSIVSRSALALALACLAAPVALLAQEAPPPPDHPDGKARAAHMIHHLKERLNLTDAQVTQVKEILKGQKAQMDALRNDTTLSREDRRAKAMALRKSIRDQIRAILTADQQAIFDKMPPPGARGPRGPRPDGDGAPDGPPPPAI